MDSSRLFVEISGKLQFSHVIISIMRRIDRNKLANPQEQRDVK